MQRTHRTGAALGALLTVITTTTLPAFAQTDTEEQYRKQCVQALGLSADLAATGTYKLRVDNCIRQRTEAELNMSRNMRLQMRAQAVAEQLTTSGAPRSFRVIPAPETPAQRFDRFQQLYNAETTYRKLQINKPASRRETVQYNAGQRGIGYTPYQPVTTQSILNKTYSDGKPSRRSIQQNAYSETKQVRIEAAKLYRQQLQQALEECSHITNNFNRVNCVRSAQRRFGSQ